MSQTVFLRNSLLFWLLLQLGCSVKNEQPRLPYYNSPSFTPLFFSSQKEAEQQVTHIIPSFSMTDQHGHTITEKDITGKIHLANFIFTSCGSICPVMTKNLQQVQEVFGNDTSVVLLSFSVTPWIDSVPRLKHYAQNNAVHAPNWHLLTGSQDKTYTLARRGYFAEEDLGFTRDSTDFLHTEHILLVDPSRRIRGIYNGTLPLEISQLVKDIRSLKNE